MLVADYPNANSTTDTDTQSKPVGVLNILLAFFKPILQKHQKNGTNLQLNYQTNLAYWQHLALSYMCYSGVPIPGIQFNTMSVSNTICPCIYPGSLSIP